jgi:hypothetical protein
VLADNIAIAEQWRTFLMALLFDGISSSSSMRTIAGDSARLLNLQHVMAAANYLLLQDRVDDAERLLKVGCLLMCVVLLLASPKHDPACNCHVQVVF